MSELHEFIKCIILIGLIAIPCVVIGLHNLQIWKLKNTIKEHEKRILDLEKKLK